MRRLFLPVLIAALASGGACRRAPVVVTEVVAVGVTTIPLRPADAAWNAQPLHIAKLIPQDLVEPRVLKPTTAEVRVQALTNGSEIAFRLAWIDPVKNDAAEPGRMVDACAVQIPRTLAPVPPLPQMGEAGRTVEVTYWRADWQAIVGGRGDTLKDLYPNAEVTHYPFEAAPLEKGSAAQREMAKRYAPAETTGNRRVGPRQSAVEDLIAEGPSTLTPAASRTSEGFGERTPDGWAVVIKRKMPEGLGANARTNVAFAIWEGSAQEAGARKMRTGWIPLAVRGLK